MSFCIHCGTRLDEQANFCTKCGTKIDGIKYDEQNPYAPPRTPAKLSMKRSPWDYFIGVFKKYAVFDGRARRAEYWWFILFNCIFTFLISILDDILNLNLFGDYGVLYIIWYLFVFIPSLSVTVRRMHDCDRSGWYMLIPIYGWIVLPLTKGTFGPNRYGSDPIMEETQKQEEYTQEN